MIIKKAQPMISKEPTLRASSQHLQVQLRNPNRVAVDFSLHVDANAPRVCGVRGESIDYAGTRKFAHNHPRTRHYVQWCASSTGPLAPSLRPTPSLDASRQSEYLSSPRGMIYDGHRARAAARVATSPVTSQAHARTPSEAPGTTRGSNKPRFQLFDPGALSWDAPALRYIPPTGPQSDSPEQREYHRARARQAARQREEPPPPRPMSRTMLPDVPPCSGHKMAHNMVHNMAQHLATPSEEMSSKEPPACESGRTATCFRVPRLESPRRQVALQNCGANGARVAEMAVAWGLAGPTAEAAPLFPAAREFLD